MLEFIIIVALLAIFYYQYTKQTSKVSVSVPQPAPQIAPQPSPAVPSLANPIMPPQATNSPWCRGGIYCNGQPVLQGDAYVGAPPVCGTDKVQYTCVMGGNGQPGWNRLGTACTPDMLSKC